MIPIKIHSTPITEETFKKQGWTREEEEDIKGNTFTYWILSLPKGSKDPYAPCFISNTSNQKLKGLEEGEYVVELNDFGGLGFCSSEEEIEVLYEMLTKKSIYK